MDTMELKVYRCVLCDNKIEEKRIRHSFEGLIPDQSNFDLNKYTYQGVSGGKLFEKRPTSKWNRGWLVGSLMGRENWQKTLAEKLIPIGGICDSCLENNETVKKLGSQLEFENIRPRT